MKNQLILLDGEFRTADAALLQRLTPGVRERTGVFETLRAVNGGVVRFNDHYRRLCYGLKACAIAVPWTKKELDLLIGALLCRARNAGRLRVMVWRERSRVRWALVPGEYALPGRKQYRQGVDVLLVPARQEFGPKDGAFKSLHYEAYRKAFECARRQGCFEALLVDKRGRVIDGSRTSLLLLTDQALVMSPAGYGTFAGLVRRRVAVLARMAGLKVCVRPVLRQDLGCARGAWIANSLIGMMRVNCFRSWKGDEGGF